MAEITLPELDSSNSFEQGDLLLIRKSGELIDKKVAYSDFIAKLPAVEGFVATSEAINSITLTPSNGALIGNYYPKMCVKFKCPIDTNGAVQIKLGTLQYKPFYEYASDETVVLSQGQWIEAYFDNDNEVFRQINQGEASSYSSLEYSVAGSANAVQLTSLDGVGKESYYTGMIVSFLPTQDSNGEVTIVVDNLVAKALKSQLGTTAILQTGLPVQAIYNGVEFRTFIAASNRYLVIGNANAIQLRTVSGLRKAAYYDGFEIIFVATGDSDQDVTIAVDNLAPINLKNESGNNLRLKTGSIVNAIYYNGNFVQKSSRNTSFIAGGTANAITLTSAVGIPETAYYNGMVVNFVAQADTTTNVTIAVDGLAPTPVLNQAGTQPKLQQNQTVSAIYNNGNFRVTGQNSNEFAVSGTPDQVVLTSVRGIPRTVLNNLVVGFIVDGNGTQGATINVDGLGAKVLVDQNGQAVTLKQDRFISAAFKDNKFITNVPEAVIYTNEYNAVGTIANDETYTTLTLTSAYGANKTVYYPSMGIFFRCPLTTKGLVYVDIDGLGEVQLCDDPDSDFIANDISEGTWIFAGYHDGKFIKNRFSQVNEIAPPIIVDPEDPNPIIPEVNKVTVNVGANRPVKTIEQAIDQLVKEFGNDGGNRRATILLDSNYTVSDGTIRIQPPGDLSWITIIGTTITYLYNNRPFCGIVFDKCTKTPILKLGVVNVNNLINVFKFYPVVSDCYLTMEDTTINVSSSSSNQGVYLSIFESNYQTPNTSGIIRNCSFNCPYGSISTNNLSILDTSFNAAYQTNISFNNTNNKELTRITSPSSTGYRKIEIRESTNILIDSIVYNTIWPSSYTGNPSSIIIYNSSNIKLLNSVVRTSPLNNQVEPSIYSNGSNITVENGDFRQLQGNTPSSGNIYIGSSSELIRIGTIQGVITADSTSQIIQG